MQLTKGFAEVNGTRLYYETMGSGAALVFIHGFSLDTRMWDDQFSYFSDRFKVIRYDSRGFGKSNLPDGKPFSAVEDLKTLLQHLGVEKANLVGLSAGGSLAVSFSIRYPEHTLSLTTIGAVVDGYKWSEEAAKRDGEVWGIAAAKGIDAGLNAWLQHPLFVPACRNANLKKRLVEIIESYSGWHLVNKSNAMPLNPPATERLHEIKAPALIIVGELDEGDFHTVADLLGTNISGSKKLVIKDAGHMANMENPNEVNRALTEFLK